MSRNSDMGIHFYMAECDNTGKVFSEELDLEATFDGMIYLKAQGLNKVGKPRVYTEKFADSDRLRVYKSEKTPREATTVTFSFLFKGEDRYKTYHAFVDYISKGFKRYYDTARKKYLYFFLNEEVKPAEEIMYGGSPYLTVDVQVQNIFGQTFDEPI